MSNAQIQANNEEPTPWRYAENHLHSPNGSSIILPANPSGLCRKACYLSTGFSFPWGTVTLQPIADAIKPLTTAQLGRRSFSKGEFAESVKLEQAIKANLRGRGYGG